MPVSLCKPLKSGAHLDDVAALRTLLELTERAQKLVETDADTAHVFGVIRMLRNLARAKNSTLAKQRVAQPSVSKQMDVFKLCLVGIGVECSFDSESIPGKSDLLARLNRVASYISAAIDHVNLNRIV
jgi:hypothetical protein